MCVCANVGDARDLGLIPWLGRSPGVGNGTYSSSLAWKIPWTEEPDGLQSMESQESDIIEGMSTHTHIHTHTRILKVYISYMSCCIFNLYMSLKYYVLLKIKYI